MNCPRCHAQVAADDVNLQHLLAKCRGCQEVFRFSAAEIETVSDRIRQGEPPIPPPREEIEPDLDIRVRRVRAPRPPSLEVEDWGEERRLVRRWFNITYLGRAAFCVVWDGFLIFWYSMAFKGQAPWIMVLFPVLHLAVGVGLTYATIAGFFNRTVITLRAGTLAVWHGPLPWFGGVELPADAIEQLYCTEAVRYWNARNNYYAQPQAAVQALLANGTSKLLVNSLPRDEALFIEQQLEEWRGYRRAACRGRWIDMNCPRCSTAIVAEDVSLEHLVAKCRRCQEVFRFSAGEIEALTDRPLPMEAGRLVNLPTDSGRASDIRKRVPQPASITVAEWQGERRLAVAWERGTGVLAAIFCVLWDGVLGSWLVGWIISERPPPVSLSPLLAGFALGSWITYWTLATLINNTVVSLEGRTLRVRHQPLPWVWKVTMPTAGIRQFYCSLSADGHGQKAYPYVHVNAILQNGAVQPVLKCVGRDEGLFVEQQLEDWLGIVPARVPGQVE